MKKNVNVPVIVTALVAVCLVAVVAVLGIKASNSRSVELEPGDNSNVVSMGYSTISETAPDYDDFEIYTEPLSSTTQEESSTSVTETSKVITSLQERITTVIEKTTTKPQLTTVVQGNATIPVLDDDELSRGTAPVINDKPVGDLPKDMYFSGLHSLGYDVIGPKGFIFNDDTADSCTQRKFGYNLLYDRGARLIDFSIQTKRIKFDYDNKEYMIQLWKGQYISGDIGTVGGEVGFYTRPKGKISSIGHYDCAGKEDWLYCELTIFWDEFDNGEYLPQLTRKYDLHWWETGYVDGQLKNRKDSRPLQILQRITFKTVEQATLFENAMVNAGFRRVATFDPTVGDTCKRHGKDVIYLWHCLFDA